jgi:hypothetical protein
MKSKRIAFKAQNRTLVNLVNLLPYGRWGMMASTGMWPKRPF